MCLRPAVTLASPIPLQPLHALSECSHSHGANRQGRREPVQDWRADERARRCGMVHSACQGSWAGVFACLSVACLFRHFD